MKLEREVN